MMKVRSTCSSLESLLSSCKGSQAIKKKKQTNWPIDWKQEESQLKENECWKMRVFTEIFVMQYTPKTRDQIEVADVVVSTNHVVFLANFPETD